MLEGWNWIFYLTLALIGASVIDDLRSRKVHNSLVTSIFVVSVWAVYLQNGWTVGFHLAVSILAAFLFCLPLYLMKAIGGGDVKLLIALSPLMGWADLGWTLLFSLVWGAVLGLVMVLLRHELGAFLRNLTSLALRNPVTKQELHKVPYTVAILFGFLTQMTLVQRGVSLL